MKQKEPLPSSAAVVVGYHPDIGVLGRLLISLASQVDTLILVDNGGSVSATEVEGIDKNIITYIDLIENKGLGAALNAGIRVAIESGAEFIALFDQDSAPPAGLIESLLGTHRLLAAEGRNCAAASPVFFDRREGVKSCFPLYQERNGKILTINSHSSAQRLVSVDALITSGMMIKAEVWQCGYAFDEGLFVDYTDTEWCFRVRHGGYQLFANLDLEMGHAPSDAPPARIFGLSFFRYSPIRRYYYYRNTTSFLLSKIVSRPWKTRLFIGICLRFIVNTVIDANKLNSVKMMTHGIWDGIWKKSGPYA